MKNKFDRKIKNCFNRCMAEYIPFYSNHTSIKNGSCPTFDDITALNKMRQDAGLVCIGEVFVPIGSLTEPLYSGPELTQENQLTLCITKYLDPAVEKTNQILDEYRQEFLRVNGEVPEVKRNGSHYVEINGTNFPIEKIPVFLDRLKEKKSNVWHCIEKPI